jgi:Ca2+/Na+ antiporter
MPRSLSVAGGELLISAAALTLVLGSIMLTIQLNGPVKALVGIDLMVIGIVLIAIYGYYLLTLVRYYGEGADNLESVPVDPSRLGHDTRWRAIAVMFLLGIAGSYGGGESIGAFAETMLNRLQLPTIPTAALLAFFAGVSEYVIVYKSHRRGELGIALSNVFGGLTQVLFLLLPFALIATGVAGVWSGNTLYAVPVNSVTVLLVLLLFPLFYALHQFIEQEKSLSNLDAAGMTGVYLLVLYFLLTAPA